MKSPYCHYHYPTNTKMLLGPHLSTMPSRHRHHPHTPHSRRNRDTQPPPASPAIHPLRLNGYFLQREISNLIHTTHHKQNETTQPSQVKSSLVNSEVRLIIPVSVSVLHARGIDDCSGFASSAFTSQHLLAPQSSSLHAPSPTGKDVLRK